MSEKVYHTEGRQTINCLIVAQPLVFDFVSSQHTTLSSWYPPSCPSSLVFLHLHLKCVCSFKFWYSDNKYLLSTYYVIYTRFFSLPALLRIPNQVQRIFRIPNFYLLPFTLPSVKGSTCPPELFMCMYVCVVGNVLAMYKTKDSIFFYCFKYYMSPFSPTDTAPHPQ